MDKLRIKNKIREGQLVLKKYQFRPFSNARGSAVVFEADGLVPQGGLVDRLKGIISIYYLCKKYGVDTFRINFTSPFKLEDFLIPNNVNWLIRENEISYKYPSSRPVYRVMESNPDVLDKVIKRHSGGCRFIYFNMDILKKREKSNHEQIWRECFHELFKMSPELQREIDALNIDKEAIAIHTRFVNLFGDFSHYLPGKSGFAKSVLNEQEREKLISKVCLRIDEIIKNHPNREILFFSDSNYFLGNLPEQYREKLRILEGDVQQSEDMSKTGFEAHKKSFIDFMAMSYCNKVIRIEGSGLYKSAFSKYAAIMGGSEFSVFEI
ncbi:MAG TPA: hypothetical protein DDX92_06490 [Flavobacteriales bacterium]|jgi:hypothetical protein|nr:hypothetical protein [Flavobacteriales bacterium]